MKHCLLLLSILFFLFSCGKTTEKPDENIFPKDSIIESSLLEDYMVEIFLIEAAIYKAQHDGKSVQNFSSEYYENFFSSRPVSKQKLKKSIEYYISQKQMENILQNVVTKLTELDVKNTPSIPDTIKKSEQAPMWLDTIFNAN